jgi:hypothetical protein
VDLFLLENKALRVPRLKNNQDMGTLDHILISPRGKNVRQRLTGLLFLPSDLFLGSIISLLLPSYNCLIAALFKFPEDLIYMAFRISDLLNYSTLYGSWVASLYNLASRYISTVYNWISCLLHVQGVCHLKKDDINQYKINITQLTC